MTLRSMTLAVCLFALMGCPPTPSDMVKTIGEGTIVETPTPEPTPVPEAAPTPELPQCVKLYLHNRGKVFWRAIKTPLSEGEVVEQNPSQKYRYEVCGRGNGFGRRPPNPTHPCTGKCDVSGGMIIAYKGDSPFSHAVEVSEHCVDDPIDGACKEWNCEVCFERTPYPPTCTILETRRLGTCDSMWNISTATGAPL